MICDNMDFVLIKFRNEPYKNLIEYLQDLFYKNEFLSKIAFKFLKKVYRSKMGIPSNHWRSYITELFNCYPVNNEDKNVLRSICERHNRGLKRGRGSKCYTSMIRKNKDKEINLGDEERDILERAIKWNSSVSSYYSILRKLEKAGIIEKKGGYILKSKRFLDTLRSVEKVVSSLDEENEDKTDYVYASK